jgi:hypothetical protein
LLRQAAEEGRMLVPIDTDFPALVYLTGARLMRKSFGLQACQRPRGSR